MIPWLPEMPEHWETLKAKFIFKKETRKVRQDDDVVTAFRDGQVTLRKNRREDGFTIAVHEIGYQGIRKGDLVIHGMDAFAGAIGVSDSDGKASPVYNACTLRVEGDINYFCHAIRQMSKSGFIQSLAKGIRERSTDFRYDTFGQQYLPFPPLPEQTAIANYLDAKTEQINRFIEKKEKLIALLKEQKAVILNEFVTEGLNSSALKKQTNLIWLGEVPRHWTLCKLKHIAKVQSGLALNEGVKIIDGVTFPYLRVANVQDGYIDLTEVKMVQANRQTAKRVCLQKYDLLMNEGGDFDKLGRGVVWEDQIKHCLHQNHVFAVRVKKDIDPYWINILTQTFYGRSYFISKAKRTTNLASISSSNIKEFPVLLPPKEEIDDIKNRIEDEFSKIDNTIARIEKEIEKVKELKQSLIAEVVTGRIKVA